MATYHLSNLLEKMTSADKDYRFMATNDLMSELQKENIILDEDSEKKVVKMLLKLLEDKNGEVQNLAVKCMGPLVGKVKDPQVENIVESLCSNMLAEKEQLRDISSIGLKTVLAEISPTSLLAPAAVAVPLSQTQQSGTGGAPSSGPPVGQPSQLPANVVKRITPRIVSAISKEDVAVQLEALDILATCYPDLAPWSFRTTSRSWTR
jgi:cullin-associated NEDD8-dissociated protein 1